MLNNVDSVVANEALQQTSAPPCSPRYSFNFSAPLQPATKRLVINKKDHYDVIIMGIYGKAFVQTVVRMLRREVSRG